MTHEFGHALGLDDTSCDGYIMQSPGRNHGVGIHPVECSSVNRAWVTLSELMVAEWNDDPENECYVLGECSYTPLVLDLSGDGIFTEDLNASDTLFDIDADGVLERTGWVAGDTGDDAFLWLDVNNNGKVDGGQELFGSASTDPRGAAFGDANGFEVLAQYDSDQYGGNGDGKLDRQDAVWPDLQLWLDVNNDGESERHEIQSLAQKKIVSFDLGYTEVGAWDGSLNKILATGSFWVRGLRRDLRTREIADIIFRFEERD